MNANTSSTVVNFLGGSPLNRLSWLRASTPFFAATVDNDTDNVETDGGSKKGAAVRWIVFRDGQPLVSGNKERRLARLETTTVRPLLGVPGPAFGQGRLPGSTLSDDVQFAKANSADTDAIRLHGPPAVFLGLHESDSDSEIDGDGNALPSSDFSAKANGDGAKNAAANIRGTLYFALDVSEAPAHLLQSLLDSSEEGHQNQQLAFVEPRAASASFDFFDAAVFAQARSMLDWNARNKFCPACGAPTYSLWAGWKRACSTLLPWARADSEGAGEKATRKECPSAKGIHNYSHPRTDAVVIMAVIDESGEKILLGRNRKFPDGFYSTLAGFIEPGESFEDAVAREIWEEAGVRVWGVKYHSGQPWPYPASLMVGFYSFADATKPVRLDLDNELVDARWFSRDEVNAVLAHVHGSTIRRGEFRRLNEDEGRKIDGEGEKDKERDTKPKEDEGTAPAFRVPPATAIAGVLIRDWARGVFGSAPPPPSGSRAKQPLL